MHSAVAMNSQTAAIAMAVAGRTWVVAAAQTISLTTNADAATVRRRNAASTGSRRTVVLGGVIAARARSSSPSPFAAALW